MPIDSANLDQLVFYMHERERIRIKKAAGEPRPWTDDPALQIFKFTNVLRRDDHTTKWLVDNWYEPNKDAPLETLLLNCGIARYFGTVEFCEALGFQHDWNPDRIMDLADDRIYNRKKVFTAAYVITNGGISAPKFKVVVEEYLTPFQRNLGELCKIAVAEQRWEPVCKRLSSLPGFGGTGFMGKEVMSDFILATKGRIEWFDLYEWSPVGPGARKGLNFLYGRPEAMKIGNAQALQELREIAAEVEERLEDWMPQFGADLDLHGIQFSLCEHSKRMRFVSGQGRPKANYTPR